MSPRLLILREERLNLHLILSTTEPPQTIPLHFPIHDHCHPHESPLICEKPSENDSFLRFPGQQKNRSNISQTNPLGGSTAGQSDNLQQRLRQHQQRFGDRLEDVLLVPVVAWYVVNEGLEFEGFMEVKQ